MKNIIKFQHIISIFFILLTGISHAVIPQAERDALVALYNVTNGANWTTSSNWDINNPSSDPCDNSWEGIDCGVDTVIGVYLADNNLLGTIPPQLEDLTNLQVLDLVANQLSGNIPQQLTNLNNLQELLLSLNHLIQKGYFREFD
jgi:Leucine-rich repeat (LRR) protein